VTIPLQSGLVYGPIKSRRLGTSLGVNVLPGSTKICNFNCVYCQYGWTRHADLVALQRDDWPAPPAIASAVEAALNDAGPVDCITLAGNGEPTLHPAFDEIVERLRDVRSRCAPDARLGVLSNSSTAHRPAVAAALARLDDRYMKLDAGDDTVLRKLNGAQVPVSRMVDALHEMRGIVIQSLFARDETGKLDNSTNAAVAPWLAAVRYITPREVHIYTLDRPPAWTSLQPVPRTALDTIAAKVRAAGIEAWVF
jgi:wyosine [tRNA(Phe)-imidazoG37] synthetase (radical SAM superfamily)